MAVALVMLRKTRQHRFALPLRYVINQLNSAGYRVTAAHISSSGPQPDRAHILYPSLSQGLASKETKRPACQILAAAGDRDSIPTSTSSPKTPDHDVARRPPLPPHLRSALSATASHL